MGIYIRGMEMPKSCMECRLCNKPTFDFSAYCSAKVRDIQNWEIKQDWCPLIEIPPHGRLNVIEPYMQHDEDDGFDELIKPSDIDYMHTPSVEEIIKGDGE